MFNGMPTRVAVAMIVCAQLASMFFAITLPVSQLSDCAAGIIDMHVGL